MTFKNLPIIICILLSLSLHKTESSKILFFFGLGSYSHRIAFQPLAEKLADRGHEVDIFSSSKPERPYPRVTEVLPGLFSNFKRNFGGPLSKSVLHDRLQDKFHDPLLVGNNMWDMFNADTADLVRNEDFQEWARSAKYDLIIYHHPGKPIAVALAYKMKAKFIAFMPAGASPMHDVEIHGLPIEPSWLPDWVQGSPYFLIPERFIYAYNQISWYLSFKYTHCSRLDELIKELYPEDDIPPSEILVRNFSLILLNEHYSTGYPRALPPYAIPIGGMHVKESTESLPQDIDEFISTGDKFLWKWEGDVPTNLPTNILAKKWFPQNEILAHPKCKGFITQGGQLSVQQAAFHGVPMITVPVWADQPFNSRSLNYNGIGIHLDLEDITKDTFSHAIQEMLTIPKYSNNAKLVSERFKDRPSSPVDTASWWVEYAIRHDTSHLKHPDY
ncbi:unnamed protein product [Allacma fusca]|uniref:UDP-glucuronosyltransferase n=1 Tax=Allacma fusca TaxID=39272 RepID=A0A8J2P7Q8_9HEXA|nr:unnamed protein product [Allacma fusca]